MTSVLSTHSGFQDFRRKLCLLEILCIFLLYGDSHASFNGFQVDPHSVPLEEISSGGPPRDGIPALMNPQFLPADKAEFLLPHDRVLGILGANQAKAYPIAILNWHEIVNDTLDGTPVVITYCPLCGTGMGFLGMVGNHPLTFGVSGLLYQSDVLMYDHQTESLWSQIARRAVTGKHLDQDLEPIFLEHTTWSAWRKRHPHTFVLSRETGFTRDYSRDPYEAYALTDQLMFPPAIQNDRLSPKAWALGVEVSGKFKAYPFPALEEMGPAFSDSFHGREYVICWDKQARNAKVVDQQGEPFSSLTAYWFAWYAFHPDTEVFIRDSRQAKRETRSLNTAC